MCSVERRERAAGGELDDWEVGGPGRKRKKRRGAFEKRARAAAGG
jgi:hypothetical protein